MHKQTVAYQIQRWHVHGARFVFSTYKRRGYVNSDTFYTWKRAKLTSSRTINGKMTSREQRSQQQKCFVPPSPLPRERATITATPTTCRTVIFTRYLAVRMRASRIGHDSAANPIQPSVRHRFWRVVWRTPVSNVITDVTFHKTSHNATWVVEVVDKKKYIIILRLRS